MYLFDDQLVSASEADFAPLLRDFYATKRRPLCRCRNPGVPMYIAKLGDRHVLKRMPNSAAVHHADCSSYDPPEELSGLGEVQGSAIVENPDQGVTALKLDFGLSKAGPRQAPAPSGDVADSVTRTDGGKLTLRSMLHYLWEQAGLTKWTPAMRGKRSWFVVRKYLLQAAEDKVAKGVGLAGLLYIPESFNADRKDEIAARRTATLSKVATATGGRRDLLIVVGEVKEFAPSRYGQRITFKHLPDCPFMLSEDLYRKLFKRFAAELEMWDADPESHLVLVGTFGVSAAGVPSLEEVAVMTVTEQWIPFEHTFDKQLVGLLIGGERRFTKSLRYNLQPGRPLACAVLTDVVEGPVAMYVTAPSEDQEYRDRLDEMIGASTLPAWSWDVIAGPMPALPARGTPVSGHGATPQNVEH